MKKHFLKIALGLIGITGALSLGVVNAQEINKDIILQATSTETDQTLKINKYFANAYTVDWGDGSPIQNLTADTKHTYNVASGYTITLSLSGSDRWTFKSTTTPLVPTNGTSMTGVRIVSMPSLADGFGESATNPGDYFFSYFNGYYNFQGAITSLPAGSFDTSNITTVGDSFFSYFNYNGKIASLPEGSFIFSSGLTTAGNSFFSSFNYNGKITSLPEGSFDTSNITTVGDYFFNGFNNGGQLTSLPANSFDISSITIAGNSFFSYFNSNGAITNLPVNSFDTSSITIAGNYFFSNFNSNGKITNLPANSFDISNITTVGDYFFSNFNSNGKITGLPANSFDISSITTVGDYFFLSFNTNGQLTSLPEGSFRFSTGLTTVKGEFFSNFNYQGKLTNLPEGSFKTENITVVGYKFFTNFNYQGQLTSLPGGSFKIENITTEGGNFFSFFNREGQLTSLPEGSFRFSTGLTTVKSEFFSNFNYQGALTSLPEGSFDTSNITTVDVWFFYAFNGEGQLTSLPEGSFNLSNITTVVNYFFGSFNYRGAITSLPDSFKLNSAAYNKYKAYENAFNSPDYTLNKKVSDLVSGVTAPLDDRNTFSDNQPGRCGVADNWLVTPASEETCRMEKSIILQATSTESNQTLRVSKYFNNTYIVDRGDGSPAETVSANRTHTYTGVGTYTITLSLTGGATRWRFKLPAYSYGLIPKAGTTMTGVKIVSMPSLADGFGNSLTQVEDYFFRDFNREGAITSLPAGSFDTSKITSVGIYFFYGFNLNGALTSLPEGSFRFSTGLTIAKSEFFRNFNNGGALTSLPEGSFDISHITTVNTNFFTQFNRQCVMTSLPNGSFRLSTGLTTVGDGFFQAFNIYGQLTSLPAGSFDTSHISSVGTYFFSSFNSDGQITNLPEGSFRLSSGLTIAKDYFFSNFNRQGQLISLPAGSFDVSNIDVVETGFFAQFNDVGALRILPNGSFKLSTGLTTVGAYFFHGFNRSGSLESLPEGSFNTSQITSAEINFFYAFNRNGSLESLPEGSFDISNITTGGSNHFGYFNSNGAITTLPSSFKINSVGATQISGYDNAFNSPNYTINRKVSDLVSGVTVPLDDRDTFSNNQPGRCGVHANWLVTTADACSISYDDGLGGTGEFKYNADTTGVVVGSGMSEPTRIGYTFSGWLDVSGNKVDEVIFPDMDGQTLNANREINQYTITLDIDGTLTTITGDYGSPVNKPSDPTRNGYKFIGWEPEIPSTMPAEDMTVKAKWERNGSSGGGGGGGGSSSSSSTGSNTTTGSDNSNNTGNQQPGSGANSSTGTQNEQTASGTNINEPEGTGKDTKDTQDSSDNSLEGQGILSPSDSSFTKEQKDAYEFAKGHGITTMPTIQKADMNGKLTRIAMAKMLSQYAMNVLGQKPSEIEVPNFNDVTDKQNSDYDDGVTLAYQLGIMGQNMPGNNFRPDDEVTRAEFATALSRMIYKTSDGQYKSTPEYYVNHMKKLKEEGIITKTDPKMKELRGYVMIMLMRSAK